MTICAAILDDEPIVATDLARQIQSRAGWNVAGVFHDARALYAHARGADVDVCFLDIETPEESGMSLAQRLRTDRPSIAIVFVTAYHQYAAQAFRVDAIDYLVKPVTPQDLEDTCRRIEQRLGANTAPAGGRLAVLSASKIDYVPIRDIWAARAAGNYVALLTDKGEFLHRVTMAELTDTLASEGFVRTHRSHLVSIAQIAAAATRGEDVFELRLTNGHTAPVSETFRPQVSQTLTAMTASLRTLEPSR